MSSTAVWRRLSARTWQALRGRVDEEVEAVADVFGRNCTLTGFYSYGEISPFNAAPGAVGPDSCRLHNQTMTITTLSEN